jgi:hypothetical protein
LLLIERLAVLPALGGCYRRLLTPTVADDTAARMGAADNRQRLWPWTGLRIGTTLQHVTQKQINGCKYKTTLPQVNIIV